MSPDSGELSIQAHLHPTLWWVLVSLEVGGQSIDMVVDSGSPLSSISQATYFRLSQAGAIDRLTGNGYVLRHPVVQGQSLHDLVVRISRRVTQVGAAGVLGLDFLGRFTDVHFHVPSLRLTLR